MSTYKWEEIAKRVGALEGQQEHGGDRYAKNALSIILGDDSLREAVDYYIWVNQDQN